MKTRTYIHGRAVPLELNNPGSTILEVEMDDGRTVQLVVNDTGHIGLRAWANIPINVGNATQATFECLLQFEEQTFCGTCYNRLGDCICGGV